MTQRGSIRRRGETWTAYWRQDTATGRKLRSKGGFTNKRDAQAFLTETLGAMLQGTYTEPSKLSFGDYLRNMWLPSKATSLRPSTWASYQRNVELHIVPGLGHIKLQHLTSTHLDRFYTRMLQGDPKKKAPLSAKTVRNLHGTIRKALRDAERKQLIVRNVADAADPPKLTRLGNAEMVTWSPSQLRKFFEGIAHHRLAAAYVLAATTGMRRGEVLGVRWSDLDLKARRLAVRQTVLTVQYRIVMGTPKTARSRRSIALDDETLRILSAHRSAQAAEKLSVGAGYADLDLVFAREDGRPIHPDYFSQTFDRTVRRLGLPKIRLHDLRHTHATLGLAAGVPVKIISERLGHSTVAFTQDIYMHAIPQMEEDAADQIANLVFGTDPSADPGEERPVEPDDEAEHGAS